MAEANTTVIGREGRAVGPEDAPAGGSAPRRAAAILAFIMGLATMIAPAGLSALDLGPGLVEAEIEGRVIDVFTYRPSGCAAPSVLLVFHGNGRTAETYRDSAREIADRGCFAIYAPLFDEDRFPNWRYHRGGIVKEGELLPEEKWTVELIDDLVAWARKQEGRPNAPVLLFGHSAGGQFLSRVAAYGLPLDVARIVIANPSSYVVPSTEEEAPYGFGLLPEDEATERMRAYLAAPVTVFLGLEDTGDKLLTMNEEAQRQGENRLERGRHVFEQARQVAQENGWPFNWELVYAEDVGHTGRGMLTADEVFEALGY